MAYFLEILNELDQNVYGVPFKRFVTFFIIILSTFVARYILFNVIDKKIVKLKIAKSEKIGMVANAIKDPFGYLILIQGFYLGIISLELPEKVGPFEIFSVVRTIRILAISFIVLYFSFRVIDIIALYMDKKAKDIKSSIDGQVVSLIVKSLRILVVTVGLLSILSNFGYNITSLIAGLGLGGLAIALAAQTTISNLFGSVTIFSDKPFRIGDTIQIGDTNGTVEEVGFRTTHIRRPDQALVIVPNSKFVNTEITNYSAMTKRKIEFYLKVTQDSSVYDIKAIVDGVKKIICENEIFDHSSHIVRFTDFGEWSMNIYVYVLVKTTDAAKFKETQEDLNIEIMRLLDDLSIEIAYPSQTIYVRNDNNYEESYDNDYDN